jgi:Tfp pilus assembly protein PilX
MRHRNNFMRKQSGIALITTLLLLLLMSAMVVGFILLVTEGQRLSGLNNEQTKAFYGAESGMEKLTADLGSLLWPIPRPWPVRTGSTIKMQPAPTLT